MFERYFTLKYLSKSVAYLIFISFFINSCGSNDSAVQKEYIKNLEEKNKILEGELQKLRAADEQGSTSQHQEKKKNEISKNYFTIGSTEDEVLSVMGDPTSLNDMGSLGKVFYFGISRVDFQDGKVHSYSNSGKNLKVKVKE